MPLLWTMPDGHVQLTTIADEVLERERLGALTAEGEPTRIVSAGDAREILRLEAGLSPEARRGYTWTATESTESLVLRLAPMIQAKTPGLAGGVPSLVTRASVPTSRRFRNQWRHVGTAVAPDVPLCRTQRIGEIRTERDTRLAASDGAMAGAQEQNTALVVPLKVYRQALRDLPVLVTAAMDALSTAEALEAYEPIWPAAP